MTVASSDSKPSGWCRPAFPTDAAMDLEKWTQKVRSGEFLAEEDLKALCDLVKEVLVEESNVQPVSSPVTVSGGGGGGALGRLHFRRSGATPGAPPRAPAGLRRHPWSVSRPAQALRHGRAGAQHQLHLHGRLCGPRV